ncbi:MAG TPA: Zn-dependent alcohol dehydrogenase [Sphaerochaeta sp.]|jgi:L-iditol 2-dehydrogenase|nr:MAG: Zn-dependent alcohol dehydrogenase [Spirochaetes bacterium GWC2_52_13]OHD62664.1 MAG: Zn-dependent alcohol dehydrogenase [Spirochaetes bacterium GWF2_52_7]PKL10906.1 MAG: Zn-dependent alcohol dehydrogenase [Spirochaetae bacterium HGW-Spirochaetae-8]PKL22496.1 MAG: Zn-dependent alcohol dehydrogenase [Spirochaetae bacterium HGW-Spirochaetae-4]HCJ93818.1 Zn-dependent alcohol dehydrogenase [Sphaerochaeta sp.]
MLAFIYDSDNKLSLKQIERPASSNTSAVVKVEATSICGTDLRAYRFGSSKIKAPRTIGHEMVGTIVEIGKDVKNFSIGDRVQVAPAIGCGVCPSCRKGKTNLCDSLKTIGFEFDGTFAEYVHIPVEAFMQDHVSKVPDGLDPREAVLTEPIACIVNAQQYLNISKGDIVAIFGSGFIGTMHAQLAYHQGASKVFMIDVNDARIAKAKEMLPMLYGINSMKEDLFPTIMQHTDNFGVDVAITACSVGSAQSDALGIIAKQGRISLFGGLPKESKGFLDSNIIHYKEISLFGAHASTVSQNRYVLDLIARGKLNVKPFIEKTFPLSQIVEAFEALNNELIVKAVLIP